MSNHDPDIFVSRVNKRRLELQLDNDELLGILAGNLIAVCDELEIDALELVIKGMELSAARG